MVSFYVTQFPLANFLCHPHPGYRNKEKEMEILVERMICPPFAILMGRDVHMFLK